MNALVPIGEMERLATAIAKSRLFGIQTAEQALTLMAIAQAEGRHPALAAQDYHIVQNRPVKKAEAMLRDFLAAQGRVEWHKLDDTIADATFSHPTGGSVRISWDMERAKRAELSAKSGNMYTKYPRQMLRSRVVSEGVRTVFPAATSGMYVPEEATEQEPAFSGTTIEGHAENNAEPEAQAEMGRRVTTASAADPSQNPSPPEPAEDKSARIVDELIKRMEGIANDRDYAAFINDPTFIKQHVWTKQKRPDLAQRIDASLVDAHKRITSMPEDALGMAPPTREAAE